MKTTIIAVLWLLVPGALMADQDRVALYDPLPAPAPMAVPTAPVVPPIATRAAPPHASRAPAAWDHQDPADSLYRAARAAMNQGEHARAATLFHQVWDRYPRSTYAPDAPYWEAFNRYRIGETEELERSLELLGMQRERYPEAATRSNGDARSLETRVRGLLARRGNADAAEAIVAAANEVAGLSARMGAEVASRLEVVAEEMSARGEIMAEQVAAMAEHGAMMGMALGRPRTDDIPENCRAEVETGLAALNALMHMRAERALPVLERVMARRDECSTPLRRQAVFLVAEKHSPRSIDLLLEAARTDPDLEVRRRAVFWLAEVDDPRAVEALARFVAESDDDRIRERAVFALSQHDSPEARAILRRLAGDESVPDRLRLRAIFWLGSEGDLADLEFLKQMFPRTTDPEMRERIVFSVGQTQRGEHGQWLLSVASDDSVEPRLRRTAIFWAAESGASAADLGALYQRVDDRAMKERILFGLSESDQPAAIDRLVEIARTERDPELRQKALFWLGHSNDPRAADVLMEVLANPGGGG